MSGYSIELLNELKAAYASGTTSVSYKGRTVNYRSLAEMERIIARIERELGTKPKSALFVPVAVWSGK